MAACMEPIPTPVLDDHLHLHPDGKGVEAVEEFARVGGTHLMVVNRPSWHFVDRVDSTDAFQVAFERTCDLVEAADAEVPGRVWAVLGVHPVLLPRLVDERDMSPEAATALMQDGLELAASYVDADRAIALKSGRPHFEVDEDIFDASNAVMRHAFALGGDHDCAVQLHTESGDTFEEIATWAAEAGLSPDRVVKHYATGPITGVTPSVIARSAAVDAAVASGEPFMLETDFLDDPDRPGAVLGPKLVPRRSRTLAERGDIDALERAHIDTPAQVYGVDTEATMER